MADDQPGNNVKAPREKTFEGLKNQFVESTTFKIYSESQDKLCESYRNHQIDLIEGVRDEIKNAIYLTGTILGLIVTVSTIALLVWGGIGGA